MKISSSSYTIHTIHTIHTIILYTFGEMDSNSLKMIDVMFFQKFFAILKKGHL